MTLSTAALDEKTAFCPEATPVPTSNVGIAKDALESELLFFEASLKGTARIEDSAFLAFTGRLAEYVNVICPIAVDDQNLNSPARQKRDLFIERLNHRLSSARQENFSRRFKNVSQYLAALPAEERHRFIQEHAKEMNDFTSEGIILGMGVDFRTRILELTTSALAGRAVDTKIFQD